MDEFWRLPENISTFGAEIDRLFYVVVVITGIVFVAVQVALVVLLVKYRHREGRRAQYIHGSNKLEIAWTAATALIVLVLGIMSWGLWVRIKNPAHFPAPGLEVIVRAKQFEWNVTYPGGDGQIGSGDDFTVRNQLHVPIDTPVRIILESEDAIHSFFVPQLRLKQDAVPGMQIPMWFEATQAGEYVIGCAELCGLGHYRMKGSMTVHTADEFSRWLEGRRTAAAGTAPAAGTAAAVVTAATAPHAQATGSRE
jgi:cytochrome c oxidase subunit 2